MVPNYQNPENFSVYERFAQDTHIALERINPALARQHRWGGYFSGAIGRGGTYGAMDLMHQDFAGGPARMAAGNFERGITAEARRRWGVRQSSSGIAARLAERQQDEKRRQAAAEAAVSQSADQNRTAIDKSVDDQNQKRNLGTTKVNVDVGKPEGESSKKAEKLKSVPLEKPGQMEGDKQKNNQWEE